MNQMSKRMSETAWQREGEQQTSTFIVLWRFRYTEIFLDTPIRSQSLILIS